MLKIITKSTIFSTLIFNIMMFTNKVAFATSGCILNGREVDCAEISGKVKGFIGLGIVSFLVIAAFGIWSTVFWIMMIIHVSKHNVENKSMWIILMVFTGFIGALIYYFVIKRKFNKHSSIAQTQRLVE